MPAGRPRRTLRSQRLRVDLPEDVYSKAYLFLFSEAEGKIPFGAWQEFIVQRFREFFTWKSLDLSEVSPQLPQGAFVLRGSEDTLNILKTMVK